MRKAAFSIWKNRIAPVFDVAKQLYLVEAKSGQVIRETAALLEDDLTSLRVLRLVEQEVHVLVCGAISRPLQEMVSSCRIRVIPFIAGDIGEVIQMWLSGGSNWSKFSMPGCQGRRRGRGSGKAPHFQEGHIMAGRNRGGLEGGDIKNIGRRMQGTRGRGSGQNPAARCACPQCGESRPHQRGVPCFEQTCPKCGCQMIRE